jgi:hypothetical protein
MFEKKLTKRKAQSLYLEEKKASKEYKELGFNQIAKDEARHASIVKKYR